MRTARALVFPSLWYECQPLTTFEALANGVPVIVSDNCAGREAVRNEETGLWFKSGDVDDLARAMRRLADGNAAAAMGNAAYASYWRNPISLEQHLDQLEETYARMQADLSRSKADRARQAPQPRALPH
jgi:glycosyltransferase involved in cell wall biosynthesis